MSLCKTAFPVTASLSDKM